MKNPLVVVLGVVVALAAVFGLMVFSSYNGLVSAENAVERSWGDVEAAYQQRLDTIPNFVETARFSTQFQLDLATQYAEARAGVQEAAETGDPDALQRAANEGFSLVLDVTMEAVPEAQTDQLTELNAQIESVERVINHQRRAYNSAVENLNNRIRRFPSNMVAGWFGFEQKKPFSADPGADVAPEVDFD